jgi:hypothetical protein
MQASLLANIELQKHPIEVTLPLPWLPEPTTTTTTTTISLI